MQDTQTVLVILLSIGFLILVIMGIIVSFVLVKILLNIRRVTQRLDETTENMGEALKYAGRKLVPAALSALSGVMLNKVKSKMKGRK
ncbi:MAG TPA: hypothetical protein VNA68_00835 [Candidatus Dormibacteraeota bacterium]|nr:hypothetical protein [Candidatus Dormibacteraeota bacterium]